MRDFTLVIPTYNRPHLLASLLGYLQAERAECHVLVADSSRPESLEANRKFVAKSNLDVEYVDFPVEMDPFDKFRESIHMVRTSFCALCADDDLVVLDGVRHCLDALRVEPRAGVAQGYSFSFLCRSDGGMDLGNILYFTPTIDASTPLERVSKLFSRALAAIEGTMIRVPHFSHGRSMDASESYERWHPLEWFTKDPQGLIYEYHFYRDLMAQAVVERPDNSLDARAVRRILDLIHLRYMIKHAPDRALAFVTQQKLSGVPFDEYWPCSEIHVPLYEAAYIGSSAPDSTQTSSIKFGGLGTARTYHLHPGFSAPMGLNAPEDPAVNRLLRSLHKYRFKPPHTSTRGAVRTQLKSRRSITVSVLLCNYNDAHFLPDSLSAICTQTRLPEEVIVLDDGSTDNSLEIIDAFARRYPFVRILKNETNRGLLYSINRALKEARSEFIIWAAADDRLMPNFIERNAQCLREHPEARMTCSRLAVFQNGSDIVTPFTEVSHGIAFDFGSEPHYFSPVTLRERLQRSHIWISGNTAVANRAALIQAGGFDPELRWHADYFTFLVVALRHGVCCIPETLAVMRQHNQTYSSRGMAQRNEQRATLGRLADKLTMKGWRDVGVSVLRCPAVLSPFGGRMLEALLRKPRRWPFAVTFGLWWAHHQYGQRSGIAAHLASRVAYMALRGALFMLAGAHRLVLWARRRR